MAICSWKTALPTLCIGKCQSKTIHRGLPYSHTPPKHAVAAAATATRLLLLAAAAAVAAWL